MQRLLVALERGGRLGTHVSVERTGVVAAAREQELQDGDVEPEVAALQNARPEERTPERAERDARPRVRVADREAVLALKAVDRGGCLRPGDAVDLREVEAVRAQGDLQPGDLRVDPCVGDRGQEQRGRDDDEPQTAHESGPFAPVRRPPSAVPAAAAYPLDERRDQHQHDQRQPEHEQRGPRPACSRARRSGT